ncbi:MAG: helix-turn-helix domain-containing protein [Verrucomicrobiota bacterium]
MGSNKKLKKQNEIRCHVETAIAVVGGKWKPWILWHLYDGVRRYGELRRLTPGITGKMLTQHLRELENDGVVDRKIYRQKVPKVEYSFTKYGETLRPLLKELCQWGAKHGERSSTMASKQTSSKKLHQQIKPK